MLLDHLSTRNVFNNGFEIGVFDGFASERSKARFLGSQRDVSGRRKRRTLRIRGYSPQILRIRCSSLRSWTRYLGVRRVRHARFPNALTHFGAYFSRITISTMTNDRSGCRRFPYAAVWSLSSFLDRPGVRSNARRSASTRRTNS